MHADSDDLDNPLRGGQPVRTYEVNSRLAAEHAVTVFTASFRGSSAAVQRGRIAYRRLGMTVPRFGLSSHLTFQARLPAALRRTPHDLVVEEFAPPFGLCALDRYTDRPVVGIVQWFFFDDWTRRYRLPFEDIMRRRLRAHPFDHVIVQTHRMADYFRELLPRTPISKVPCGIGDTAFDGSQDAGDGDYALFLGRLDIRHKGLDDLLDAWTQLRARGTAVPLWIVGAGPDEAALRAGIARRGLDELVSLRGRLEGDAKREALKGARFLVMPSRYETFGLVALEAMACARPVIAYDIAHLNELLRPSWSVLVDPGRPQALADAVATAWQDPAHCLALGRRAYLAAQDYRWDRIAEQQQEIYLNTSKQRPSQ